MNCEFSMVGALAGLALAIFLIIRKVQPVYSLILGAFVGGLIGGGGLGGTVEIMVSGAQSMISPVLRILTSGVLVGAMIKTGSTDRIAETIIHTFGEKRAIIAIALATMVICAIGVFIPIAVITVAPIALAIGKQARIPVSAVLLAMIGGGKAGNIISPNPNTIAVAEAFGLNLTSLMVKNAVPAIVALGVTVLLSVLLSKIRKDIIRETEHLTTETDRKLPAFWQAVFGPCVVLVLLILRPLCGIEIDPLIALPAGGVVCILVTGKAKSLAKCLEYGMGKVVGICVLLMSTGTLAGIIKASDLQENMIAVLEMMNLPVFLLAPLSGMLLAAATASTTAGATIASQTFGATLLSAGVPALEAGAMINASATVIDSMPHGSFFHASGGAVNMDMKERMKLIPFEALVGGSSTVVAVILYIIK